MHTHTHTHRKYSDRGLSRTVYFERSTPRCALNAVCILCAHTQLRTKPCVSVYAVPTADGEADDRVLGAQPRFQANRPAGEEDTRQDVRVTGHQTVRRESPWQPTHVPTEVYTPPCPSLPFTCGPHTLEPAPLVSWSQLVW